MSFIRAAGAVATIAILVSLRTLSPATPSLRDIQAAYDREAVTAGDVHDKGLKIVGLECAPTEASQYSCQVGFTKADEGEERVYLDAALVEKNVFRDWKLLRGLCKRLL